jgi:hypothetical protein
MGLSWTFTSTVVAPDGCRVTATVELPPELAAERTIADSAELAQMAASNCAKQVRRSLHEMALKDVLF